MRYAGLPPGTIIQQLYLRKRIKIIRQGLVEGTFLDVGAGEGYPPKHCFHADIRE